MKGLDKKVITISFDLEFYSNLKKLADKKGLPVATLIKSTMKQLVDKEGGGTDGE